MIDGEPTPSQVPRALAEPSGFVDVYRRVLSPQTRRAIAKKVSPRARHQLKQWVARAAGDNQLASRRGERLARRQPELLAGETVRWSSPTGHPGSPEWQRPSRPCGPVPRTWRR